MVAFLSSFKRKAYSSSAIKPKASPYRHYEKENRAGFGIQVSPKGTKSFFYAYKVEGKQRFMKLGVYRDTEDRKSKGKISLKEAGIKWEECRQITREQRDPQTVRDNKREEDTQIKIESELTAEALLTLIKSVDSIASSLDADLLDGKSSEVFAEKSSLDSLSERRQFVREQWLIFRGACIGFQ